MSVNTPIVKALHHLTVTFNRQKFATFVIENTLISNFKIKRILQLSPSIIYMTTNNYVVSNFNFNFQNSPEFVSGENV